MDNTAYNKKARQALTLILSRKVERGHFYLGLSKAGPCLILVARKGGKGAGVLQRRAKDYREQIRKAGTPEIKACWGDVVADPKNTRRVLFEVRTDGLQPAPSAKTASAGDLIRKEAKREASLSFLGKVTFGAIDDSGAMELVKGESDSLSVNDIMGMLEEAGLSRGDAEALMTYTPHLNTGLNLLHGVQLVPQADPFLTVPVREIEVDVDDDDLWNINDMDDLKGEAAALRMDNSVSLGGQFPDPLLPPDDDTLAVSNGDEKDDEREDSLPEIMARIKRMDELDEKHMEDDLGDEAADRVSDLNMLPADVDPLSAFASRPPNSKEKQQAREAKRLAQDEKSDGPKEHKKTPKELLEAFTLDLAPPADWQDGKPHNKHFAETYQRHMLHLAKVSALENYGKLLETDEGAAYLRGQSLHPDQIAAIPMVKGTMEVDTSTGNPTELQSFLRVVLEKGKKGDKGFTLRGAARMAPVQRAIMAHLNHDFHREANSDPGTSQLGGLGRIILSKSDPQDKHFFVMYGMVRHECNVQFTIENLTFLERVALLSKQVPVTINAVVDIINHWCVAGADEELNLRHKDRVKIKKVEKELSAMEKANNKTASRDRRDSLAPIRKSLLKQRNSLTSHRDSLSQQGSQKGVSLLDNVETAQEKTERLITEALELIRRATREVCYLLDGRELNFAAKNAPKLMAPSGEDEPPSSGEDAHVSMVLEIADTEDDYYNGLKPPKGYKFKFTKSEAARLARSKKSRLLA